MADGIDIHEKAVGRALENAVDALAVAHMIIAAYMVGGSPTIELMQSYFFNLTCLEEDFVDEGQWNNFSEMLEMGRGGITVIVESKTGGVQ